MTGPYNKKSQGSLRRLSFFKILFVIIIIIIIIKKSTPSNYGLLLANCLALVLFCMLSIRSVDVNKLKMTVKINPVIIFEVQDFFFFC